MIRGYGISEMLGPIRDKLSDAIIECMVEALEYPDNKRAHRFIPLEREDFYLPSAWGPSRDAIAGTAIARHRQNAEVQLRYMIGSTLAGTFLPMLITVPIAGLICRMKSS